MRFGIGWRDLAAGLAYCVAPFSRSKAYTEAAQAWSDRDDCLILLSVRSAFDLLLQELALEPGDEVLLSAWTVPDMIRIVEAHGLVPVPVDVDHRGHLCMDSLPRSITSRAQLLVVAHLFGGRTPLDIVAPLLKKHGVMLVEDCAQSFDHVGDTGHPDSDVVMHSFGPIKTATALGGAVVRVASRSLRNGMESRAAKAPVQTRFKFLLRVLRFSILKLLSGKHAASVLFGLLSRFGVDIDAKVNSLGRGFIGRDILKQIRIQPSGPLLKLMTRRFKEFDFGRIEHRKRLGEIFDRELGFDERPADDSRWICPLFVPDKQATCDRLRAAGFDATCRSRMVVVPAVDEREAVAANANWDRVVFLPWYPDLNESEVRRMASVVRPR
jgi:dTDP-4-amino-4,6-dideoxygalactose transaminase